MNKNDPLATLLTDDMQAVNKELLASFLKPYINIDKSTHEIGFLPNFDKLNNLQKIVVVLLSSKVKSLLFAGEEGLTQSDIIKFGIAPEGSVKSTLKRLFDNRGIKKNGKLRYFVPNYAVATLIDKWESKRK